MTDEYQLDGTTWFERNASDELLLLLDVMELSDTSTAPSTAGEFRLDGSDVKVQTGGQTKNLTNVGTASTAAGGNDTELQYNASGGFGGIGDFEYDGTNLTSMTPLDTVLTLLNQGADPTTNGEIQNNGGDIKAYSGGAVRNLSNIGSGSTLTDSGSDTDGGNDYVFPSSSDNLDFQGSGEVLNAEEVTTDGVRVRQGRGLLGLPTHHINYTDSLSNEEIARFNVGTGNVLELWRLDLQLKGGGTDGNVSIDVRDVSNSTTLGSTTAGSLAEGGSSPLGTSGAGATITVRLTTGGSSVNICPSGITAVVAQ